MVPTLTLPERERPCPARRRQRGLGLVEFVIATAIVALALLAHASGSLAGFHLARTEESRSLAIQTLRRFVERLRTDDDWTTLHQRLEAQADPLARPSDTVFDPTVYYPDFQTPPLLRSVGVRVDVPDILPVTVGPDPVVLREDAIRPKFGLPYDLNGDGVIDSDSRNDDYLVLPVRVRFQWQAAGEIEQTLIVTVWLHGERI